MLSLDNLPQVFERVLTAAHHEFGGTRSAFDNQIATGDHNDSAWLGIYNAIYTLARTELKDALTREDAPAAPGGDDMRTRPDVIRARRLEALLGPQINALVADCKGARYTGWSMMHGGPIRRVDGMGRTYYAEESDNPPARPSR